MFEDSCGDVFLAGPACQRLTVKDPPPFVTAPPQEFCDSPPPGTCAPVDPCSSVKIQDAQGGTFTNSCDKSFFVERDCELTAVPKPQPPLPTIVFATVGTPALSKVPPPTFTVGVPTLTPSSGGAKPE